MTYFDTFNQFLKLAFQSEMSKFKKTNHVIGK